METVIFDQGDHLKYEGNIGRRLTKKGNGTNGLLSRKGSVEIWTIKACLVSKT